MNFWGFFYASIFIHACELHFYSIYWLYCCSNVIYLHRSYTGTRKYRNAMRRSIALYLLYSTLNDRSNNSLFWVTVKYQDKYGCKRCLYGFMSALRDFICIEQFWYFGESFQLYKVYWKMKKIHGKNYYYADQTHSHSVKYHSSKIFNNCVGILLWIFVNKRPTGLNGHLSVNCNAMKMKSNQISKHMYNVP